MAQFRHSMAQSWRAFVGSDRDRSRPMTAAAAARLSWATRVESIEEAPPLYRGFLESLMAETGAFPHAALTPTFRGYMREEKEKLVCVTTEEVVIAETSKDGLDVTRYRGDDIHSLEAGSILLYAWLTIRGRTKDGELRATVLKFNAVTSALFFPIQILVRRVQAGSEKIDISSEQAKFRYLRDSHFKLMNFARRTIAPGETVITSLVQPRIRTELVRVLGRSLSRTVTMAHLTILTDRELIIIRDDDSGAAYQETSYGGIWTFIPLAMIQSATVAAHGKETLALEVQLPADKVASVYAAGSRQEVEALAEAVTAVRSGRRPE